MFSSIVSIIGYTYKAVSAYLEFKNLAQLVSNKSGAIKAVMKYLSRKDKTKEIEDKTEKTIAKEIKKEDQTIVI